MLKEMVQTIVKDSSSMKRIQNGQLQLAGLSNAEQRALVDVVNKRTNGSEPRLFQENVWR